MGEMAGMALQATAPLSLRRYLAIVLAEKSQSPTSTLMTKCGRLLRLRL
jgi:hypothetical protein